MNQDSPFAQFFFSIPICTRILLVATLSFSIANVFIPSIGSLCAFDIDLIGKGQLWRLFTPYVLHQLGFPFIMSLFIIYNFSRELEERYFKGDSLRYMYYLLFVMCLLDLISVYYIPLQSLLTTVFIYTASRSDPTSMISLFFGITLKRMYLPWAYLVLSFLMSGMILPSLLGILVGHCYYFLKHVIPVHYPHVPILI